MIQSFTGKYSFLSNFYRNPVILDGILYPSAEHAYMSHKSDDLLWKTDCQDFTVTPAEIKKLSRSVKLVDNWDNMRLEVMYNVLKAKFNCPVLAQKLKETGDQELIEGNTWNDTYWGVCNGIGHNHLGKLLMQVRSELK